MNILEKILINDMDALFRRFWSYMYIPFLNALFPSGSPYIFFFQICAIEHSPRNFAFGLATPSLSPSTVFSDLTPPVFFIFFFFINYSFLFYLLLQSATTPSPDPNIQFICPMCYYYPLVFHNNIP